MYAAEKATIRPIRKKEQPTANFALLVSREVESEHEKRPEKENEQQETQITYYKSLHANQETNNARKPSEHHYVEMHMHCGFYYWEMTTVIPT